ncbi:MAG TPA: hypothetical protein VGR37_09725 [Longimicrobiaceae bacterium]|nr:hypothetical protein [Longimicrobiaceae bacterium]
MAQLYRQTQRGTVTVVAVGLSAGSMILLLLVAPPGPAERAAKALA